MDHLTNPVIAYSAAVGHVNTGLNQYKIIQSKANDIGINIFEILIPAVTNMTLGLEILIKLHHFQQTEKVPWGHDIQKLGSSFPEKTMESLRAHYKKIYDDPNYDKGIEVRFSSPNKNEYWPEPDFDSYDKAISYIGNMYVEWRYFYEKFTPENNITISFMPIWFAAQSLLESIHKHDGNIKISMRLS